MKNTIQNLTKAFISESQARNRYTFYASIAKKEGLPEIATRLKAIAKAEEHSNSPRAILVSAYKLCLF